MAKVEILTLSSIAGLFNLNSLYVLGYAALFGASVWVSFFGGIIAFRVLPRKAFGTLQHSTFPIYFLSSIIASSALLGLWTLSHPDVLTHIWRPTVADVAQVYALALVVLFQGTNYFVVGPMTSSLMFKRQRQEKEEGKSYSDDGVSAEMLAMNKRFGALHGVSSLGNLGAVLALGFHGLWIANAGVKGY